MKRQPPLPASPEAIAAWAKETRERLNESSESVAKAMHEEKNEGAPFEVPREKIDALLRLWVREGRAHYDLEKFYPKTAPRIRALIARESRKR